MGSYLKKVVERLSTEARGCLDAAISLAVSRTHHEVEVEHLLLVLITRKPAMIEQLCLIAGLQGDVLLEALQVSLSQQRSGNTRSPVLAESLVEHLEMSWLHASVCWQQTQLSVQALMGCLFVDAKRSQAHFAPVLQQALLCNSEKAEQFLHEACASSRTAAAAHADHNIDSALKKFTRNLTEQARNSTLDPALGRESEIRQIIDVLLRRRQNNPVLTGEPGVGKTALVEGLAQRIIEGTVPDALKNMEILSLDMGLLQAGASVKGEFEQRLQTLLREVKEYPSPVILFIDEAHTLIGAGGQAGQNDAANLLKPALARGEMRVVAATTWAEYKKYFEKDAALARRFQVVKVAEPDEETAIAMLRSLKPALGKHHNVQILESALVAAVRLSSRYISGRQLPDKSISLLDTACARVAVSQCHAPKEIEDLNALLNNLIAERESLQKEGGKSPRLEWLDKREKEISLSLSQLQPVWQQQQELVAQINGTEDSAQIAVLRGQLPAQRPLLWALGGMAAGLGLSLAVAAGWYTLQPPSLSEKLVASVAQLEQGGIQAESVWHDVPPEKIQQQKQTILQQAGATLNWLSTQPADALVGRGERLSDLLQQHFPNNEVSAQWLTALKEKAGSIPALDGYIKANKHLDELDARLLNAEKTQSKYMTVSELKTAVYQIRQDLQSNGAAAETLLWEVQQTGPEKRDPAVMKKIEQRIEALNSRYLLLKEK